MSPVRRQVAKGGAAEWIPSRWTDGPPSLRTRSHSRTRSLSPVVARSLPDANALFTLIPTSNASTQFINFYSDQSWSDANDDSLTCAQKVALAKQSYSVTELAGLPKYIPVRGSVPRWWYVAFSNCAIDGSGSVTSGGISLSSWRLEFTNHAGTFQHQFSMDEQGILEMSIFFAALFFVLMIVLLLSVCLAKRKGQTSVVMQLVFLSILLEFIALAFNIGHYGKFSQDGRGVAALASLWYCQSRARTDSEHTWMYARSDEGCAVVESLARGRLTVFLPPPLPSPRSSLLPPVESSTSCRPSCWCS